MAKAATAVVETKKVTKRQQVLDYCAAHPAASNEEVAKALGKDFTALSVGATKSQEKARLKRQRELETTAPIDLPAIKASAPKIVALGGPEAVLSKIKEYEQLKADFGSIDRAKALSQSLIEIREITAVK